MGSMLRMSCWAAPRLLTANVLPACVCVCLSLELTLCTVGCHHRLFCSSWFFGVLTPLFVYVSVSFSCLPFTLTILFPLHACWVRH
uniref:Uncharacterized protein n=1 Tax=Ixodes ricinus TaxID=34613 RepID=A0A6B0U9J9_IXORI